MHEPETIENIHGNDGQTTTEPAHAVHGGPGQDRLTSHDEIGAVARLAQRRGAPSAWRGRGRNTS